MNIFCWGGGQIENKSRDFSGGQTKFFIKKLRASFVEGETTNRGREARVNQGRNPNRRRERLRIEGEAKTEGEPPKK